MVESDKKSPEADIGENRRPAPGDTESQSPSASDLLKESSTDTAETSVEKGRAKSTEEAWDRPGTFHVEKDGDGNVTRIEGWLSQNDQPRTSADSKLQKESKEGLTSADGKDGSHLIAHSLGGPSAATHGRELTGENLVPADSRINRSYMADVERSTQSELDSGRELFMRVDVSYSENENGVQVSDRVTHSWFERQPDGSMASCDITHRDDRITSADTATRAEGDRPPFTAAQTYGADPDYKNRVH